MTTIIVFCIPIIMLVFSGMDVKEGKREKLSVKKPFIILLCITFISILINIYLLITYNINLFPNLFEGVMILIAIGVFTFLIFLIIAIVNLVVRNKNLPKSEHNPKLVWYIPLGVAIMTTAIFVFAVPTGQKLNYVNTLKQAEDVFANTDSNDEISLVLLESERDCLNCYKTSQNIRYDNRFYVKNNLDQPKKVQVEITAFDENEKMMKIVNSIETTLAPGKYTMVTTSETSENKSVWDQYSFKTNRPILYYEYIYYYDAP